MKWIGFGLLALALGSVWFCFAQSGMESAELKRQIASQYEIGDPDGKVAELDNQLQSNDNFRIVQGVLLTFLTAGVIGVSFVVFALPFFAQRATHAIYDSAEMIEKDVMHSARSLLAQGEYDRAIEAFKQAATADPLNRLPWVEIAKIQKINLGDATAAIATIRYALESQAWEVNDAAYFLFRLAELYDEVEGNRESAIAIMHQVIEQFPETRHSANANHKLHEWKIADAAAQAAAEEAEYQARMQS